MVRLLVFLCSCTPRSLSSCCYACRLPRCFPVLSLSGRPFPLLIARVQLGLLHQAPCPAVRVV